MQASTSQTPTTATPPAPPADPAAPVVAANPDAVPAASYIYEAARASRKELREQQEALIANRHTYVREIEDHNDVGGPAITGMQQRIVQLDQRIAALDQQIIAADAQVARAAAVPGAVTIEPPRDFEGPPEIIYAGGTFILLAAILPISIALARRVWRKTATVVQEFPRELMDRLGRLEQLGEATAIEVERIGEGQRFVTRLMNERTGNALGEGTEIPR